MSWLISLIPVILELIANLIGAARDRQLLQAGADQAIAEQATAILKMTETGKRLMTKIAGMSDDELNQLLKDLGSDDKKTSAGP